jgi:hypothetical protein
MTVVLTTNVPIFPGTAPGRGGAGQLSGGMPSQPVRGPGWSVKVTPTWNNVRQKTTSGKLLVVKYWSNPLWQWEWTYEVILDNPNNQNGFYTGPIPFTDYQILSGFYNIMQGGGNMFAYQPADSTVGTPTGSVSITQGSGSGNLWTLYCSNNFSPGLYALASGLTTLNFLNGQPVQILYATSTYIIVFFSHAGTIGLTNETGTLNVGTPLVPPDSNANSELRTITGGYPTLPLTGTPSQTNIVDEAVQLIDSSSLVLYSGTSIITSSNYSLLPANSVAPYQGLVVNFTSSPSPPIFASFNKYYVCRFTEDSMEFENFMSMLWLCQSFKFEQVRI